MLKARWNARENAPDTEVPLTGPDPGHRQRQGRRRQELGHRQPRRRRRRAGLHRRGARRRHLGLLGAAPAGHRRAARGASRSRAATSRRSSPTSCKVGHGDAEGRQHRLPGRGGHGADVARADAHQGGRAVPARRALGRARLPVHRHAPGHRRRADGPGPHAAAHRSADRHDTGPGRPEGGRPGRRHGPAQLPAGVRRDREHGVVHVRARSVEYALFG